MKHRPWLASYPTDVPPSLAPYPDRPLFSLLADSAGRHPNAVAVAFLGKHISYRELLKEVDQFSRVLSSLGVRAGDRVGLVLPNCPQYVISYYAILRLGGVVVGNNPLYTDQELAHQLLDAGIELCIVLDQLYPKIERIRNETTLRDIMVTRLNDYLPFPKSALAPLKFRRDARKEGRTWPPVPPGADVKWWHDVMKGSYPPAPVAEVDPKNDIAALLYTGGTTGTSKGAALTHRNLVCNAMQAGAWFPDLVDGKEAFMCVVPFFHAYGLTAGLNVAVDKAAKLIVLPRFDLKMTFDQIRRERPTLFPGVPRLYSAINEAAGDRGEDLRSIRACVSGAAPLPAEVAEKFERLTGGSLVEGYGMTEASPVTHANPVYGKRKAGSIGLPFPDTDCRLADLDDWTKDAAPGAQGELLVSGPQVMKGYWNRPEETEAQIKQDSDGTRWLLTGDVATMDDEGYFYLVDRKKEIILVSGFNVYPTEVEKVLSRHDKVERVCVVGVPHPGTGEVVKAYVVLKKGETASAEEILEFAADERHGLTGYRVPKLVEFRESLPETLIGKVLRRVLLEEERQKAASRSPQPTQTSPA